MTPYKMCSMCGQTTELKDTNEGKTWMCTKCSYAERYEQYQPKYEEELLKKKVLNKEERKTLMMSILI